LLKIDEINEFPLHLSLRLSRMKEELRVKDCFVRALLINYAVILRRERRQPPRVILKSTSNHRYVLWHYSIQWHYC